jgi:tetratricopeptide (TPR) repeat protein
MRPRSIAMCASILLALLSGACTRISDYAKLVEGNRLHERGDYQGAILDYLSLDRSAFPQTLDYDLANSYARLGEYEAAAELYGLARAGLPPRGRQAALAADSHFNEGLALFERGSYERSWKSFRAALGLLDPESREAAAARRNLELAWRAWKKEKSAPPRGLAASQRGTAAGGDEELRLLMRLETGHWRPGGSVPTEPDSADY